MAAAEKTKDNHEEIMEITMDNYEEEVLKCDRTVLLDFWAQWCVPCRMVSPVIEEIAREHPEIKVGKVNVDDQMELAVQFKVMGIPALFVVKEGKVVNRTVGAQPKQDILDML